jgi:predicted nuclease with RNAse H fold
MFLGGLTARAIKLKAEWNEKGIDVWEVWPRKLAQIYKLDSELYKKDMRNVEIYSDFLRSKAVFKREVSIKNWHQVDAVLAYLSGLRILNELAMSFGDPEEGMIYA